MKVMNFGTSLVLGYYVTKDCINLLEEKVKEGLVQEVNIDNDICLFITIDYNPDIENCLRLYLDRIGKSTSGNKYNYEVELDYTEIKDDKNFIIQTDDNKFYKCSLFASEVSSNTLILKFKII